MKKKFSNFKNHIKKIFNKRPVLMRFITALLVVLILNQSVAMITDVNVIGFGFKKLLNTLGIYTDAVHNVELKSDGWDDNVGGAWHIDKSAKWTGVGKAQVTFDLDTIVKTGENKKDVIFVLDISGSMTGEKLEKVKDDTEELVGFLLSDRENSAALITFDTNAEILSDFTKDKDALIQDIQSLSTKGNTNYNDALLKVEEILSDYELKPNTDAVVLFLTDGFPCQDTPNQVGTFQILKDTYPFVIVNGIQYEMGIAIKQELIEVSDYQYYANMETLNNVLFEAAIAPEIYDKFEIVDYIDDEYFYVANEEDIHVTSGTVELVNETDGKQKIIWNFGDSFKSGMSAKMTIDLILKDKYLNDEGISFYPTNKGEEVNSKLSSDNEENDFKSSLTPVLKNSYVVTYDYNAPSGCNFENINENHYVFESVTMKNEKPVCSGYIFKGWEIVEDDVTKINDDVFTMPGHDVTIRGTWSTFKIAKSVDGEVHEDFTLFKQVKRDAESGNGAGIYTGDVTDEVGKTVKANIYYYTSPTNNNLIFGNFCWQIVRTTATDGVKIMYNGVPKDGKCNNSGTAQQISQTPFNSKTSSPAYVGYMYNTEVSLKSKYMGYNDSSWTGIIFGKSVKKTSSGYELQDTVEISEWKTDRTSLVKDYHYTCFSTTETTCQKVAYVYYTDSSDADYVELDENFSDINQILEKMLSSNDIDSDVKKVVDTWYEANMTDLTQYLEDTVFCNDRSIIDLGSWNPNGGGISSQLKFNNDVIVSSHVCPKITDQFAMGNSVAHLEYPVGLLTAPEATFMGTTFSKTNQIYWLMSPSYYYGSGGAYGRNVVQAGTVNFTTISGNRGVRPVVSLKPNTYINGGNGTNDDPFTLELNSNTE